MEDTKREGPATPRPTASLPPPFAPILMMAFWMLLGGAAGIKLAQSMWQLLGWGSGNVSIAVPVGGVIGGLAGALLKRNALSMFLSIELMMNAVNVLFLTYARMRGDAAGQMIVFFVIAVAAAEAGVGLAIFVALFRTRRTVELDRIAELKW